MFKNNLCTDPLCEARKTCAHMGPQGQYCHFAIEQELCRILGRKWDPLLRIELLLADVEEALGPEKELLSRITGKMKPSLSYSQPPKLEPLEETKDE